MIEESIGDERLVELAYRFILGKRPESPRVVAEALERLRTVEDIREELIRSSEFEDQLRSRFNHIEYIAQVTDRSGRVEVGATPAQLDTLFDRIRKQWLKLGETEPYWSVLTSERFKKANIARNVDEFYRSGRRVTELFEVLADRNDLALPNGTCLELGCGTGRITQHLAGRFPKVIATDVSRGNLAICREHLQRQGIGNVDTILLTEPRMLERFPTFGVFVSFIVLQHNPPPVQYYMLDRILSKLRVGGVAFFQVAVLGVGYGFDLDSYLASEPPEMEMHCLPMRHVMEVLRKHDFAVLEVIRDSWTGPQHSSYTFLATKREDSGKHGL